MTIKEAFNWCCDFQDNIVLKTSAMDNRHHLALEAVQVAKKALSKEIALCCVPKERTTYNGYVRYTDWYCPVCSKQQKKQTYYGSKREQEGWYCERCGQKLMRLEVLSDG